MSSSGQRDRHGSPLRVAAVPLRGAIRPTADEVNQGRGRLACERIQADRIREAEAMLRRNAYALGVKCRERGLNRLQIQRVRLGVGMEFRGEFERGVL